MKPSRFSAILIGIALVNTSLLSACSHDSPPDASAKARRLVSVAVQHEVPSFKTQAERLVLKLRHNEALDDAETTLRDYFATRALAMVDAADLDALQQIAPADASGGIRAEEILRQLTPDTKERLKAIGGHLLSRAPHEIELFRQQPQAERQHYIAFLAVVGIVIVVGAIVMMVAGPIVTQYSKAKNTRTVYVCGPCACQQNDGSTVPISGSDSLYCQSNSAQEATQCCNSACGTATSGFSGVSSCASRAVTGVATDGDTCDASAPWEEGCAAEVCASKETIEIDEETCDDQITTWEEYDDEDASNVYYWDEHDIVNCVESETVTEQAGGC